MSFRSRNQRPRGTSPRASLGLAAVLTAGLVPFARGSNDDAEATYRLSVLDNGSFAERGPDLEDEAGRLRIPWWRSESGMSMVVEGDGGRWLRTRGPEWASQPIPGYAPLIEGLVVRGRVRGRGIVELTDGEGRTAAFPVSSPNAGFVDFEITGTRLREQLGGMPVPRLELTLRAEDVPPRIAHWSNLEAEVELPLPSEEALRAEVLAELKWIFGLWFERGIDDEGTVKTGFLCNLHDVITGERLRSVRGGYYPLFDELLTAVELEDVPEWHAALDRYIESYLTHGMHPETGLPRPWDPKLDVPIDHRPLEVAAPLGFLLDVAARGPQRWRGPALEAATRAGETILAKGVLPDGAIAPRYRPSDGEANNETPPIRRLDVPAQLGRLGALSGDERFTRAARRAVSRFEFTHYWAGTWDYLDPGFDDFFGHFARRSVLLWEAHPDEAAFARIPLSGFDYYAPIWHDAMRLGGYIAADEVRCWQIITAMTALDDSVLERAPRLLHLAARTHFKGEQYPNSTWGDVTYYEFDPKVNLEVGDLRVIPRNLLHGVALIYEERLGLPRDEIRALFTSVLRSTMTTYKRPYGVLSTLVEKTGAPNRAGASIRLTEGLVEMLRHL